MLYSKGRHVVLETPPSLQNLLSGSFPSVKKIFTNIQILFFFWCCQWVLLSKIMIPNNYHLKEKYTEEITGMVLPAHPAEKGREEGITSW